MGYPICRALGITLSLCVIDLGVDYPVAFARAEPEPTFVSESDFDPPANVPVRTVMVPSGSRMNLLLSSRHSTSWRVTFAPSASLSVIVVVYARGEHERQWVSLPQESHAPVVFIPYEGEDDIERITELTGVSPQQRKELVATLEDFRNPISSFVGSAKDDWLQLAVPKNAAVAATAAVPAVVTPKAGAPAAVGPVGSTRLRDLERQLAKARRLSAEARVGGSPVVRPAAPTDSPDAAPANALTEESADRGVPARRPKRLLRKPRRVANGEAQAGAPRITGLDSPGAVAAAPAAATAPAVPVAAVAPVASLDAQASSSAPAEPSRSPSPTPASSLPSAPPPAALSRAEVAASPRPSCELISTGADSSPVGCMGAQSDR